MSTPNNAKIHNIDNISYSANEGLGNFRARDNSYEDLNKQHNNPHIYDVPNVADPTADVATAKPVQSGIVAKGGNRFVKPKNGAMKQTTPLPEGKLSRKTIVLLIVGTLLLCTFVSLISGIIAYHVTSSKMATNDEDQPRSQSSSQRVGDTGVGSTNSEIAALKHDMSVLNKTMTTHGETFDDSLSEARDFLLMLDRRLDQMENALHQHKISSHNGTSGTTSSQCQEGWVHFNGKCYFFSEMILDFQAAKEYCKRKSSKMVRINGPNENIFVKSVLKRMKAPNHWLGMRDKKVEGHWEWNDGVPVTFTDWHRGKEPNGGELANCAVFWDLVDYQWADNPCSEKYSPLCEKAERKRKK